MTITRIMAVCGLTMAVWLGGCAGPEIAEVPEIAFPGGPVVRLEAERPASLEDDYRPPLRAPHVEHLYRIAPAQIARTWLRERVALSGSGGTVRMTIHDASVVEEKLANGGGVLGFFRNDPDRRLTARLDVTLTYVGWAGSAGSSRAVAEVSRTLMENADEAEVEAAYFQMMKRLSEAFDAEMRKRIDETYQRVLNSVG